MKEELNKLRQQLDELQSKFDDFAARVDDAQPRFIVGQSYEIKSKNGRIEHNFEIGEVVELLEDFGDYGRFWNGKVAQTVKYTDFQ